MANPVEIIGTARRRIGLLAAARISLYAILPALTAVVLYVALDAVGAQTWGRLGYVLTPSRAVLVRDALLFTCGAILGGGGLLAFRAWTRESGLVAAASRIDDDVGAHQQVLTLATLSEEPLRGGADQRLSPLYPELVGQAGRSLEAFDPRQRFKLKVGRPLIESSLIAAGLLAILSVSLLGLVRPPTDLERTALKLRVIADEIESSARDETDSELAAALHEAARELASPSVPREEKLKHLDLLMKKVEKRNQRRKSKSGGERGKGKSGEKKSARQAGGEGKGEGTGKANASGHEKSGGKGKNVGKSGGSKKSREKSASKTKGKGGTSQAVELQNELKKAKALVETAGAKNKNPTGKLSKDKTKQTELHQGKNKDRQAARNRPNPAGAKPQPPEKQIAHARASPRGEKSRARAGSHRGDTHLGEFPAPGKARRFLKPGDKGPPLTIRDARYVMFRLPSAIAKVGAGKTVSDKRRRRASVPYVNLPLIPARSNAPVDERQFVPPRYRDLIR